MKFKKYGILTTLLLAGSILTACGGDEKSSEETGSAEGLSTNIVTIATGGSSGPYNIIGTTLGLGVGGAIVSVAAIPLALFIGGQAAVQVFAIGALAFDAEAIVFAPFYAVELEPVEWETPSR